jgi:hypothetical protein
MLQEYYSICQRMQDVSRFILFRKWALSTAVSLTRRVESAKCTPRGGSVSLPHTATHRCVFVCNTRRLLGPSDRSRVCSVTIILRIFDLPQPSITGAFFPNSGEGEGTPMHLPYML